MGMTDSKIEISEEQRTKCQAIIHGAAGLSAAAGGIMLLPGSDSVAIMPVQVGMILALAKVFDVKINRAVAKSAAYSSFGTILGKGASRLLAGLVPGAGNVVRAGVAFSITEALGWAVVEQLQAGEFV